MVVRGVYTKAEEEMIAMWKKQGEKLVGWLGETFSEEVPYPVMHRVATKELILHMAQAADYWNPLWSNEEYARNTRWGGIIAPPAFQYCISHAGPNFYLSIPPEIGESWIGMPYQEYWEFFKPIHVNDSFKVWVGHHQVVDWTELPESPVRRFKTIGEIN
jgi:hypothetical protein